MESYYLKPPLKNILGTGSIFFPVEKIIIHAIQSEI
jgi:hypothetical protein